MEDGNILDLYWARNQEAIARTDEKYGRYCHVISFQILRSAQDADECVNDTWLHAWNAIPPQRPRNFKAFLGKLTRNLSLDRWERDHAQKRGRGQTELLLSELEECIPHPDTVEGALEDKAISRAISAWLRTQPPRNRVAFVRRYWYGDSVAQAGKRLGLGESAAKSLLHRMRQSLKAYLEQEGIAL